MGIPKRTKKASRERESAQYLIRHWLRTSTPRLEQTNTISTAALFFLVDSFTAAAFRLTIDATYPHRSNSRRSYSLFPFCTGRTRYKVCPSEDFNSAVWITDSYPCSRKTVSSVTLAPSNMTGPRNNPTTPKTAIPPKIPTTTVATLIPPLCPMREARR
jgi:hypothetical protein